MYLTSFIHRNALFNITERWCCSRPEPRDVRTLTEVLISDGFVISETLEILTGRLLAMTGAGSFRQRRIRTKGELRDIVCEDELDRTPRVAELLGRYESNPDYYYREAPINAVACLNVRGRLLGSYRIKRPKRIAEKANRRIANWIFERVIEKAREMARDRAARSGVPLEAFITPEDQMVSEFIQAEESIAADFRDGRIRFEKSAMTIHDVGAIKVISGVEELRRLELSLADSPDIRVVEREEFTGNYQAVSLILEVPWDTAHVCRQYREGRAWEHYLDRGIPEDELKRGLEPMLQEAEPRINIEVILTTFPDMVESEFGSSIHEERIISQRDHKRYRGYIPMNVEFLVESLFAVGFSPKVEVEQVPIKLWGRYLPETLGSYVRRLYNLPEHDLIQ